MSEITQTSINPRLLALRQGLVDAGVEHKGRPAPFGVTDELLQVPDRTIELIQGAGNAVGRYMVAVNALMMNPEYANLRAATPELQALNRPEAAAMNAIAPDQTTTMFRLDLTVGPDGSVKASEIESLFGGIGYGETIRNTIFPQESGQSLGKEFARMLLHLSQAIGEPNARAAIVTLDWDVIKPYIPDLKLFVDSVRRYYSNFEILFTSDLQRDADGNLVTTDDSRPIRFVHRFFELYMAATGMVEGWDNIFDAYQHGAARDLPSPHQFFEEKLIMALIDAPQLQQYFRKNLGDEIIATLREIFPRTYMVRPDTEIEHRGTMLPLTQDRAAEHIYEDLQQAYPEGMTRAEAIGYVQASSLIAPAKEARSAAVKALQQARPRRDGRIDVRDIARMIRQANAGLTLATLPKAERDYVIKLSGFSEGAAEAKSVSFFEGLTASAADKLIQDALASGDVWVIQPMSPHMEFTAHGVVPVYQDHRDRSQLREDHLEEVSYPRAYARVEPHYFLTSENQWTLGDVTVTLTPSKRTHMGTNAFATHINVPEQPHR